jgi:hypothetical protein
VTVDGVDGSGPTLAARLAAGWRALTPVFALLLLGAWLIMGQQSDVLGAMHPEACPAGRPVDVQWSPFGAALDETQLARVVESWHAHQLSRAVRGVTVDARRPCRASASNESRVDLVGRVNAPYAIARGWTWTDVLGFTVLYGLVLVGLLLNERVRPEPDPAARFAVAERGLRRWLVNRLLFVAVAVAVLLDWAENALLLRELDRAWDSVTTPGGAVDPGRLDLTGLHVLGVLKWCALAIPLVLLAGVFVMRAARRVLDLRTVLRKQWIVLLGALGFVAVVLVPDQSADAVRRLALPGLVLTVVAVAVLGLVLTLAGSTALRSRPRDAAGEPEGGVTGSVLGDVADRRRRLTPSVALIVVGVALAGLGFLVGWHGLAIPGGLAVVAGTLSALIDLPAPPTGAATTTYGDPRIPDFADRVAVASAAGAFVLVGVAGAIVGTAAADLAYFRSIGGGAARLGLGLALLAGVPMMRAGYRRAAVRLHDATTDTPRTLVAIGLTVLCLPGLLFHDPDLDLAVAPWFGTVIIVTIFLAGLAMIVVWADRASFVLARRARLRAVFLPTVLRELNVRRPPLVGLVAVWALFAPFVLVRAAHDVRVVDVNEAVSARSLDDVVQAWIDRQPEPLARRPAGGAGVPALLVSSSGGGIRAAYWTAAVLDCVTERRPTRDDVCGRTATREVATRRRDRLLTMSGISGGSLGLAEYVTATMPMSGGGDTSPPAARWYEQRLRDDFLAPTLASYFFNDGFNALVKPDHPVDRAAITERAWEAPWPHDELGRDYLTDQARLRQPLMLLNGYSVDDGCRFEASVLASNAGRNAQQCAKAATGRDGDLLATTDLTDVLCAGTDVRWSTAALLSARFPWVSPTGAIGKGRCSAGLQHTEVADGGYHEASGASPIDELVPRVRQLLGRDTRACVVPVFLQIDNGYTGQSSGADSTVGQLAAPLTGLQKEAAGWEAAARAQSRRDFDDSAEPTAATPAPASDHFFQIATRAHPGAKAPLGWVLSKAARDDLRDQLEVNRAEILRLRRVLDGRAALTCPAPGAGG